MARPERPYTFIKRQTQKNRKPIYYARIKTDDGVYTISTDKTSIAAAEAFVLKHLAEKEAEKNQEQTARENTTLRQYAAGFWDYDGSFAQSRLARRRTISKGYLENCAGTTESYIMPKWGDWKLTDITTGVFDDWILQLVNDPVPNLMGKKEGVRFLAPATVNRILQIAKSIFEQACIDGYLKENPAKYVKPISNAGKKEKGVLTPVEVEALLNPDVWEDYRHYAINLLTLTIGIRISEVRGLQVSQVHQDYIEVHTAWEEQHGLKEPKWGSRRDLPIEPEMYEVLQKVMELSRPQTLLFYGAAGYDKPMSKSYIAKNLYKALHKIGISEEERIERNISFHSHRHTLNTMLRAAGVPDAIIRMMTGHRNQSMTDLYTHFRLEDYREVSKITKFLIKK